MGSKNCTYLILETLQRNKNIKSNKPEIKEPEIFTE